MIRNLFWQTWEQHVLFIDRNSEKNRAYIPLTDRNFKHNETEVFENAPQTGNLKMPALRFSVDRQHL